MPRVRALCQLLSARTFDRYLLRKNTGNAGEAGLLLKQVLRQRHQPDVELSDCPEGQTQNFISAIFEVV